MRSAEIKDGNKKVRGGGGIGSRAGGGGGKGRGAVVCVSEMLPK